MTRHNVKVDHVRGYERYTCHSSEHDEATLVRQPWMTNGDWANLTSGFVKRHPCKSLRMDDTKVLLPLTEFQKQHLARA